MTPFNAATAASLQFAVRARGFTLIELVVSLMIMSVVLVAAGSAVVIASRALEIGERGPDARTAEAARIIERISADLRLAGHFETPLEPDHVTFTIPDEDGDNLAETIDYAWSGPPDYELARQLILSGDAVPAPHQVIATDVRQFDLTYLTRTWGLPAQESLLESEEQLLLYHDDLPDSSGNRVLFVVVNQGAPTGQELSRRLRMIEWGYTVQLISASASQSAFEAAVAGADVAYISEEVNSSDLGTKLTAATIGVVNEEVNLVDEFGIASSFSFPVPASAVDVPLPSHFITAGLDPGPVAIFQSDQPIAALSSTSDDLAPDLHVLGHWGALPALSILDAGDELLDTGGGTPGVFGHDTVFGNESALNEYNKMHVATQVTVGEGARVTSISAYLYVKSPKDTRFGIYTDAGGEPGSLIAETDRTTLSPMSARWRTISFLEPVELVPGTYWLAIGMQNSFTLFFDPTGGEYRTADSGTDPKNGLMGVWEGTDQSDQRRVSIRAEYTAFESAAGRRVELPWGGNDLDIDSLTEDGEALMRRSLAWAADPSPGDPFVPFQVHKNIWPAQYIFPELSDNAAGWTITRVLVAIRGNPDNPGAKVRFQLRYADPSLDPSDEVLQETADIPSSTWDSALYTWYEIPFVPQEDLNPDYGLYLVIKGKDDDGPFVKVDRGAVPLTAGTHLLETADQGDSWSAATETDDLRVYVYGTYTTQGEPVW